MTSKQPFDIATKVYSNAVGLFKARYTKDNKNRAWLADKHSLEDVQDAISNAKSQYDGKQHSQLRMHFDKFSAGVMYYAPIMDMLAQHHPEYISLAWGTIKLVFVLVTNHEEMIVELANAFFEISQALPRMEVHLYLYPTNPMQNAIEELYALVILFFDRAIHWYRAGPWKHIRYSLTKPFKLEFKDLVQKVKSQAQSVDMLAMAQAHQEIREMYVLVKNCLQVVQQTRSDHEPVSRRLDQQNFEMTRLLIEIQRTLTSHQAVNSGLLLNTERSTRELQLASMIAASASSLVDPSECLRQRTAMCRRWRQRLNVNMDDMWRAKSTRNWYTGSHSSIFIVNGSLSTRPATNTAAVQIINLIKSSELPVLWALKSTRSSTVEASPTATLRYLAMQALKLEHEIIAKRISARFNAARVASATKDEDWLQIFLEAASAVPQLFMVIDAEFLGSVARDKDELAAWLEILQRCVDCCTNTVVKIVVLSYRGPVVRAAMQLCDNAASCSVLRLNSLSQSGAGGNRTSIASRLRRRNG